jgi:Eco29kI restriction endonuclease
MPESDEFRLSMTRALADQLATGLDNLTPAPLDMRRIGHLQDRPGIYQLYQDGLLVYVGKAELSLPGRLTKHYRKLSGRENVGAMTFACLYVDEDLHAVAPERLLITRYVGAGLAPWNNSGFGNNDPGKERDTTGVKDDHFDALHPARLDWPCETIGAGAYNLAQLLVYLKADLPYTFRYQRASFHADLTINVPRGPLTADELFTLIGSTVAEFDERWQITALIGYVIMYPSHGPYPQARRVYP